MTKQNLTRSIAITNRAYEALLRASQLTGLPIGALATMAIERAFDPKRNPQYASAMNAVRATVVEAII